MESAYIIGEVAEWSNAPDLKSGLGKTNVGSNPTLSVMRSIFKKFLSQHKVLKLRSNFER